MDLRTLTAWLDENLHTLQTPDYPAAHNGLQVENSGTITHVAAAVDACEAALRRAAAQSGSLLLVHHGLFWQPPVPMTGAIYRKFKLCVEHDVAVYSSHLPLDVHPEWGNNALLAQAIGMPLGEPLLDFKGLPLGLRSEWAISLTELLDRLTKATGTRPHLAQGGPSHTACVGLCTGAAGSEISAVAAKGVDTFITGEGPHWSYLLAEELGVNLIYAGHYATETFGVKALAAAIEKKFGLPWKFLHYPTGL